ncbi:MAG: Crp/Fnr family transcriptional regulator [Burkholderiaceae bacterium]
MTSASAFCTPSLLDCLPPNDRDRLRPALQLVTLAEGQDLYRTGQAVHSVYFPVTALVEEVLPQPDGGALVLRRLAAQAMAGSCVLGDAQATRTARVCGAGQAYKMEYPDFVRALDEVPAFRELVMQDAAAALLDSNRQRES